MTTGGAGPVHRQVVAEEVASRITSLIASGQLAIGDKLPPERVLARELQVSRPTLREGIRALAAVGIVRAVHGKGVFVTNQPADALVRPEGASGGLAAAVLPRLRALLFATAVSLATLRLGQPALDAIIERLGAVNNGSTYDDEGRALVEGLVRSVGAPDLAPLVEALWPGPGSRVRAGQVLVDDELLRALATRNASRAFDLAFRAFAPEPD